MCVALLTILRELGGAHQGGDLKGVLADGAVSQVVGALARAGVALLLQFQLGGGQVQVQRRVLQTLGFGLQVCREEISLNIWTVTAQMWMS